MAMSTLLGVLVLLHTLLVRVSHAQTFGQPCDANDDTGTVCSSDKNYHLLCGPRGVNGATICFCSSPFVRYPKNMVLCVHPDQLQEVSRHDEPCLRVGCIGRLVCDVENTPLLCKCPSNKPNWNNDKGDCESKPPGALCTPADNDCETGACTNGRCPCAGEKPIWNAGEMKCEGRGPGTVCTVANNDCEGSTCVNGLCACLPTAPVLVGDKCEMTSDGGHCNNDGHCRPGSGLKCTDVPNDSPRCRCVTPKPFFYFDGRICTGNRFGVRCDPDECFTGLECRAGFCECPVDTPWDDDRQTCAPKKKRNEVCFSSASCERTLECPFHAGPRHCTCPEEKDWDPKLNLCVNKPYVTFGGDCTKDGQCLPGTGLHCIGMKCACTSGSEWIESTCKEKEKEMKCDPDQKAPSCDDDDLVNAVCNKDKICTCAETHEHSPTTGGCKLKAGQSCLVRDRLHNGVCLSMRCSNGQGDGHSHVTPRGTCDCVIPPNGGPKVWSSTVGEGCIDAKFGFPCDKTTEMHDCRHSPFDATKPGLQCDFVEKKCRCGEGFNYQQGYCVTDTSTHGSSCDSSTHLACNVKNTGLSCSDDGMGGTKCLCLPKDVTQRSDDPATQKFVDMEWNAVTKKCGLKKVNDPCVDKDTCHSGKCVDGKCVPEGGTTDGSGGNENGDSGAKQSGKGEAGLKRSQATPTVAFMLICALAFF